MKTTIKTVTLTIDELNKIVTDSANGNVEAAKNLIANKINQKSERLQKQRELRRQRKEQKKAAQPKSTGSSNSQQPSLILPLSKEIAKCILWINNRRDVLKTNVSHILHEIARCGGCKSSLDEIERSMQWLLLWAKEAAQAAHDHLYAKYSLRPQFVAITSSNHDFSTARSPE